MAIIRLLRKLKTIYGNFLNKKRDREIKSLRMLLEQHPTLKKIEIERDVVVLVLDEDVKFEWNLQETNSFLAMLDQKYEVLERQIIKEILKEGDSVFDIGANFGYFTVLMKTYCPAINLYAFEPIKDTYSLLLRNLGYNHIEDVKSYNFGFADDNKDVIFHIPDQLGSAWASMGTGVSSVYKYKLNQQLAKVCRLDDFIESNNINRVDFIKCDVEGAEKLMVEGATESLKRDRPTLMLEIGNMWTASFGYNREILINQMINNFGYKCFGVIGDKVIALMQAEEVRCYREEEMYNYFFVHPTNAEVMALIVKHVKPMI